MTNQHFIEKIFRKVEKLRLKKNLLVAGLDDLLKEEMHDVAKIGDKEIYKGKEYEVIDLRPPEYQHEDGGGPDKITYSALCLKTFNRQADDSAFGERIRADKYWHNLKYFGDEAMIDYYDANVISLAIPLFRKTKTHSLING